MLSCTYPINGACPVPDSALGLVEGEKGIQASALKDFTSEEE